ncbi:myosin-IIIb [Octopus bimaculoides]|uniref:non-specific serine/threonine protein kinase n=1 Tax=Octopus bimaculoides TaxID=37653 RepID=A0A0L8G3T6_OCTBM|nr:myosin-IIIb [Octopus bimaculoides]|eukprot:XP_014784685.1 PREDICTED: myosin-IIIb-like [Octopus bimaculoides]
MIDNSYVSGSVGDLTTLSKLDENILLQELKARYEKQLIYTYIGDILIAINPFCKTGLYDKDFVKKYCYAKKSENPPHIFAIADTAYQNMVANNLCSSDNQCILISGESGAGKTESTKLIIKQLMTLCNSRSHLEQQIIQVNPLLESFGNAQTLMNDNSSRFGKYIQLKFIDGQVKGGKISEYLLEKSRVVFQNKGELNFHIFYYIFAGLSEEKKEKLLLKNCDSFRYAENCTKVANANLSTQKEKYSLLCDAMDWVGFTDEEQFNIFQAISSVLYIGNITFKVEGSEDLTVVDNENVLESISTLLEINAAELKKALTSMTVTAANEVIERNYTIEKAEDSRDAMAKVIYSRLFSWIVFKVNTLINLEDSTGKDIKEIGILDIFGFEHFENNSFEQACINLANEQLQFFFNKYVFQLEQEEYNKEGIDWKEIKFVDNQPLLNLFMEKPGLLSILDDETQFPKATDATYVQKLNKSFENNVYFVISQGFTDKQFTIKHYAAQVTYNSDKWLEKNRDTQPAEILNILRNSNNTLIKMLFSGHIKRTGTFDPQDSAMFTKDLNLKETHNLDKARKLTVGAQFKNSLVVLMERMSISVPIFIRCLKPNHERKPNIFNEKYILTQLQYTGVLETTKIRRDGFAVRPTFPEFVGKYNILIADLSLPNTKSSCLKILKKCKIEGFQIGKTRVFLKYAHIGQLDDEMNTVNSAAIQVQRVARGFVARRKYKDLQEKKRKYQMELDELAKSVTEHGDNVYEEVQASNKYNKYDRNNHPEKYHAPDDEKPAKPEPSDEGFKSSRREAHTSSLKSVDWFVKTQVDEVKNTSGDFAVWFHGIISRRKSEELLENCCLGAFLVRVSESRFGYSLSIRDKTQFRHYMIDYLPNGKYVIIGEPKPHKTLYDLIKYHQKNKISNWDYLLTEPCRREFPCSSCNDILYDYVGYLEMEELKESVKGTPPKLPDRRYKPKPVETGKGKETAAKRTSKNNPLQTSKLEKLKKGFKGLLE